MSLKNRIKLVRNKLNFTQKDFAKEINVSRSTIANIERGTNNPSNLLINHLCIKFGINEKWLRTGEGKIFKNAEEVIQEAANNLNEEELKKALHNILESIDNKEVLNFDELEKQPEFYDILNWLKEKYEESDQDMKGWLTIELKKKFPEYEQEKKTAVENSTA